MRGEGMPCDDWPLCSGSCLIGESTMPVFSHRSIELETRANYLEVLRETRTALFRLEHAAKAADQDLGATAARVMRTRVERMIEGETLWASTGGKA